MIQIETIKSADNGNRINSMEIHQRLYGEYTLKPWLIPVEIERDNFFLEAGD